jgi:hypothetical protein
MAAQLAYQFAAQATDVGNLIRTQVDVEQVIPLSANVISDTEYQIPAGAVAQPLNVPTTSPFDILIIIPSGGPIVLQKNANTNTPDNVNELYVLSGSGITAVFVSNPNAGPVNVRAIMAAR